MGVSAFVSVVVACGSEGAGGESAGKQQTPAERMCGAIDASIPSCAATPCDQALVADCADMAAVLSDPFLTASAKCVEAGGAPFDCLSKGISSLTPTPGQKEFAKKFCAECPPTPIPGCEDALVGEGDVPDALKAARQIILPFGDDVLGDIETECFGGFTCLAELSSCVQQVMVKRALPEATAQCVLGALTNPATNAPTVKCPDAGPDGGGGQAGSSGAGGSGGNTGGAGGSSGGASGSGGSGGSTGGAGGTGGGNGCTPDAFEPNDESTAAAVIDTGGDGMISDCEGNQQLSAELATTADPDWYTYLGLDSPCGLDSIQPHASVTAAVPVTVCVYLKPLSGSGPPSCMEGTTASIAGGYTGCCGAQKARLAFGANLANDEADVLIHVAASSTTDQCVAYTLDYGYGD
jgi:hypothetical protein